MALKIENKQKYIKAFRKDAFRAHLVKAEYKMFRKAVESVITETQKAEIIEILNF